MFVGNHVLWTALLLFFQWEVDTGDTGAADASEEQYAFC